MTEKSPDTRWQRSAFSAPAASRALGSAHQTGDDPALEIACPVCATFNPPTFRFCPQCGHRLRAPLRRDSAAARPSQPRRFFRPLVCLVWLVMLSEAGLLVWLGQRTGGWFWDTRHPVPSVPGRETGEGRTAIPGSDAASAKSAARAAPSATTARAGQAERVGPQTRSQPESAPVELTLFDDEGEVLRHARGVSGSSHSKTYGSVVNGYVFQVLPGRESCQRIFTSR